jgi:hypothetical protein
MMPTPSFCGTDMATTRSEGTFELSVQGLRAVIVID